jgi:glutamine synthetase
MKVKLEYVWLDGYTPEPNLRSKVKIVDYKPSVKFPTLADCPEWGFDGSSTMQAEGHFSDCVLKPVRVYGNPMNKGKLDSYLVLCEVTNPDGTPHETNTRSLIGEEDYGLWFGFEQEYTIVKDGKPLGFPINGYPEPQGKYYCGVGNGQVNGREFVEKHMENCLLAGIGITGTNAEVMLGQWEYQVFGKGKLKASDDLWVSRYMLMQMSEDYGFKIEFHPKPVIGDWNGSGLHCNFSTERMRNEGGRKYFNKIFNAFGFRHEIHIQNYGSDNHLRLTGRHETQSINKFSWGVSDRGASIRVPLQTSKNWMGYLEDRRPASNADPYKIVNVISETLNFATELGLIEYNTEYSKNVEDLIRKFSGVTSEDLLKEYYNDEKYELTGELMESKANIDSEEIEFNINFK